MAAYPNMDQTLEQTDGVALTREQIDSFHAEGFLRFGKLLDDTEVEALRQEYDHEFDLARAGKSEMRNLSVDQTDDDEAMVQAETQMLQIMNVTRRNLRFRKLVYDSRLLDIVATLIGPNIQLYSDQALFKPAHTGGAIHWHQDNAYWKCVPANIVSCWLTLDDVDDRNGAMNLIPGSHLTPLSHGRAEESNVLLDADDQVDAATAVVVELAAGGIMFHHCQTLHSTKPNASGRQRRAFAMHFMTPGTKSLHDSQYIPVSFNNPLLRARV